MPSPLTVLTQLVRRDVVRLGRPRLFRILQLGHPLQDVLVADDGRRDGVAHQAPGFAAVIRDAGRRDLRRAALVILGHRRLQDPADRFRRPRRRDDRGVRRTRKAERGQRTPGARLIARRTDACRQASGRARDRAADLRDGLNHLVGCRRRTRINEHLTIDAGGHGDVAAGANDHEHVAAYRHHVQLVSRTGRRGSRRLLRPHRDRQQHRSRERQCSCLHR